MKILISVLLASGVAIADDGAILRCRAIADAAGRLACYDALVVTPQVSATVKPDAIAGKTPLQQAVPTPPVVSQKAPATTPQVLQQTDQFGLEEKIANKTALDAIESTIPGSFEGWNGRTSFRLANGQVWQVADDSSRDHYVNNPTVRIRRGALGSFYIEIQGTNYSPRVRRVR